MGWLGNQFKPGAGASGGQLDVLVVATPAIRQAAPWPAGTARARLAVTGSPGKGRP
jgi:hypothetical protein